MKTAIRLMRLCPKNPQFLTDLFLIESVPETRNIKINVKKIFRLIFFAEYLNRLTIKINYLKKISFLLNEFLHVEW